MADHLKESEPIQTQENIIAGLCTAAPTTEIRDCLRLYKPQNNNKQHKTEFNRCQKATLVATLDFLGVPEHDQYTKPACLNILICRIQNLFPDECSMCNKKYCIGLEDTPLLTCAICGQGSHNCCVLNQLKIAEEDHASFTPAEAEALINPFNMPGIHYLCGACEANTIPAKDTGLLKKKLTTNTHSAVEDDKIDEPVEDSSQVSPSITSSQDGNVPQQPEKQDDKQDGKSPDGGDKQVQSTDSKKICPFYRKGTCRHGVSGRNCPNDHPRPCKKLLKHGNKEPHGCTLGRNKCEDFHPKMCPTSLTKGECYTPECKLRHVEGTKRIQQDAPKDSAEKAGKSKQNTAAHSETKPSTKPVDFLEALTLLKQEMLAEMDKKLAILQQNQPQSLPQVSNYQLPHMANPASFWNLPPPPTAPMWNRGMMYPMVPGAPPVHPMYTQMLPNQHRI